MARRWARRFRSPTTFSTPRATQALGKRAGKDADRNKATLVAMLGLDEARQARRPARDAIAALAGFGDKAAILAEAARFTATEEILTAAGARRWSKPLRVLRARPRLIVCVPLGVVVGLLLPHGLRALTRGLIGWNVTVWGYLLAAGVMILKSEHQDIHRRATFEDDGRYAVLMLAAIAATVSFGAIFLQLAAVKDAPQSVKGWHIALALTTVLGSWLFVHLSFALHYAHEFFRTSKPDAEGVWRGGVAISRRGPAGLSGFPVFFLRDRRGLRHGGREHHGPRDAAAGDAARHTRVSLQQCRAGDEHQYRSGVYRGVTTAPSVAARCFRIFRPEALRPGLVEIALVPFDFGGCDQPYFRLAHGRQPRALDLRRGARDLQA